MQVKAGETRHLYIGDQARGLRETRSIQEPLGGFEGHNPIPKRFDQVPERLSDRNIVIDNEN